MGQISLISGTEMTKYNNFTSTVITPLSDGDMFQDPQWVPKTEDSTEPYIYLFFLHIHTLYNIYLAYLNCQHHYSCALESLLSKIRVTLTQAL